MESLGNRGDGVCAVATAWSLCGLLRKQGNQGNKKSNQRGLKLAQWAALLGYVEIVSGVIVLTAILAITF